MGQDLTDLMKLLDKVTRLNINHKDEVSGLASAEIGKRTSTLNTIAEGLGLDPNLIADFGLAGIEAESAEKFIVKAYYRFFPEERETRQERMR